MMVAPDKAAEAAVRGKHPTISSFFSSGLARLRRAKPEEKKRDGWVFTPDGSLGGLVRGYHHAAPPGLRKGEPSA